MRKVSRIAAAAVAAFTLFFTAPVFARADEGGGSNGLTEVVIAEDVLQDTEGRIANLDTSGWNTGNFLVVFTDDYPEYGEAGATATYASIRNAGTWKALGELWANVPAEGKTVDLPVISDIGNGQLLVSWAASGQPSGDSTAEGESSISGKPVGRIFDKASSQFGSMIYIGDADSSASGGAVASYSWDAGLSMFVYGSSAQDSGSDEGYFSRINYKIYDNMSGKLVPYDGIVEQVADVIPEDMQGSAFITSYDVVILDRTFVLAYTLDTDGDLSTSSDREIYAVDYTVTPSTITESKPRRLTASGEEADALQFVRRFEDPPGMMERVYGTHLIYQSGGTIKMLDMDSETPAGPVTLVDGGVEDFIARDYPDGCYVLFHAGGQTYVVRYDATAEEVSGKLLLPIDGYRLLDFDTNNAVDGELVLLAQRSSDNALCALTYNVNTPDVSIEEPYIGGYSAGSVPAGFTLTNHGLADTEVTLKITDTSGEPIALQDDQVTVPATSTYQFDFTMDVPYRYGTFSFTAVIYDTAGNELDRVEFSRTENAPVIIPDPTYPPSSNAPEGYQVTTDPVRPKAGYEVTISVEPEGYVVITDADGNEVEAVRNPDGTWSYVQPNEKVTISVVPVFEDVPDSEWYFGSVCYAYAHGFMKGVGATRFEPDSALTRAMVVTILWRMEGKPTVSDAVPFDDVASDAWYTEAVRWAASEGVVKGVNDTWFAPDDAATREQLATILWRYAGKPAGTTDFSDYADGDQVSAWAMNAMSWCVDDKIIYGTGDATLASQDSATRAQAAAIMMRFSRQ